MKTLDKNKLILFKQASEILGITEKNLQSLVKKQKIPVYKLAGEILRVYSKDVYKLKEQFFIIQKPKQIQKTTQFRQLIINNDIYILLVVLSIGLGVYIYKYIY